jgi:hypothetical protein
MLLITDYLVSDYALFLLRPCGTDHLITEYRYYWRHCDPSYRNRLPITEHRLLLELTTEQAMLPRSVKISPDPIDLTLNVSCFQATIRIKIVYKITRTADETLT